MADESSNADDAKQKLQERLDAAEARNDDLALQLSAARLDYERRRSTEIADQQLEITTLREQLDAAHGQRAEVDSLTAVRDEATGQIAELTKQLASQTEKFSLHLDAELSRQAADADRKHVHVLAKRTAELEELFAAELQRQADELTRTSRDRLSEQAAAFDKVLSAELQAQADEHSAQIRNHETFSREVAAAQPTDKPSEPVTPGRVEDLTAQVTYLRSEIRRYRQLLESDRIEHTRQLLAAQEAADASYGKAQDEFSAELQRYASIHTSATIEQQVAFDTALAEREQAHDLALERMHEDYLKRGQENQERAEAQMQTAKERFENELADVRAANRHASTRRQRAEAQNRNEFNVDLESVQTQAAQTTAALAALERDHLLLTQRYAQLEQAFEQRDSTLTTDLIKTRQTLANERSKIAAERTDWLRKSAVLAAQADDMRRAQQTQLAAERADMEDRLDEAATRFRAAMASAEQRLLIASAREADLEARLNREAQAMPPRL